MTADEYANEHAAMAKEIAKLRARLALAEKVVEAATVVSESTDCLEGGYGCWVEAPFRPPCSICDLRAALAEWREGEPPGSLKCPVCHQPESWHATVWRMGNAVRECPDLSTKEGEP